MRRHPWIFSGAIDYIKAEDESEITEGALVEIYTRTGEFIALGHYQIGSIAVRVLTFDKRRSIRSGGTGASPWPTTYGARSDSRTTPTRTATGSCTAKATGCRARGGHLRHGGRRPVPLGRHVPRPHGDRQGDTGDLRRQNHGHLRQKFADRTVQRPAGRRGRLSVGQLRPRIAHRDGKRREIPRKLGERPEDRAFSSTSAKTANW